MSPVPKWIQVKANEFWNEQDPRKSKSIPLAKIKEALLKTEQSDRMPNALVIELLQKADENKDGYMDYNEYMKFVSVCMCVCIRVCFNAIKTFRPLLRSANRPGRIVLMKMFCCELSHNLYSVCTLVIVLLLYSCNIATPVLLTFILISLSRNDYQLFPYI